MKVDAPVILIPENIFDEYTTSLRLDFGKMKIDTNLVEYKKNHDYNEQDHDDNLYDEYIIKLNNMHLLMHYQENQNATSLFQSSKSDYNIINDITYLITVENCLGPLNKTYPTLRANIDFNQGIDIDIDLSYLPYLLRLQNSVLLELENKEISVLEQKVKKKYINDEEIEARKMRERERADDQEEKEFMRKQTTKHLNLIGQQLVKQVKGQMLDNLKSARSNQQSALRDKEQEEDFTGERNPLAEMIRKQTLMNLQKEQEKQDLEMVDNLISERGQPAENDTKKIDSAEDGANMEINMKMKQFCINIRGEKKDMEEVMKTNKPKKQSSDDPVKSQIVSNSSPLIRKSEQEQFIDGGEAEGVENKRELYSMQFKMNQLQACINLENNYNDIMIELSMHQLLIMETDSEEVSPNDEVNREDKQKLQIFKKMMYSQIDEYNNFLGDHQFSDSDSQGEKRQDNNLKEEDNQLYVQINMLTRNVYDEDYETDVVESTMDVNCLINKSRIIINFITCRQIIQVYAQLMKVLEDGEKGIEHLKMVRKENIIQSLSRDLEEHQLSAEHQLIRKIFRNLAVEHGPQFDNGLYTTQQKLEKQALNNTMVMGHCELLVRLSLERWKKKAVHTTSDLGYTSVYNTQNRYTENQIYSNLKQSEIDLDDHQDQKLGTIVKNQEEDKQAEADMFDQKEDDKILYVYNETYFKSIMNVNVKLMNMEMWVTDYEENSNQRAQILQLEFQSDLFYECEQFGKDMNCLKVPRKIEQTPQHKHIEDDDGCHANQRLHNLELKEQEQLKTSPSKQKESEQEKSYKNQDEEIEEVFIPHRRILESKDQMQFNLTQMTIQQLLIRRWIDVQDVTQHILEQQYRKDNLDDIIDEHARHNYTYQRARGQDVRPDDIDKNSELFSNRSFAQSQEEDETHLGIKYYITKILQPTSIEIQMQNKQAYLENRFGEQNIDIDPMILRVDFKDIDFLYYLNAKYADEIQPVLDSVFAVPEADESSKKEQKKDNNEKPKQDVTEMFDITGEPDNLDTPRKGKEENSPQIVKSNQNLIQKSSPDKQVELETSQELNNKKSKKDKNKEEVVANQQVINLDEEETFQIDVYNQSVKINSIVLRISDGVIENYTGQKQESPTPLIEMVINELQYDSKQNTIDPDLENDEDKDIILDIVNFYKWKYMPPIEEDSDSSLTDDHNFASQVVRMGLYVSYFNTISQAFEPCIEPWQLNVDITQKTQDSLVDYDIKSDKMLEINLTHGLAESFRQIKTRILEKTFKIDEELQKKKKAKKEEEAKRKAQGEQQDRDKNVTVNQENQNQLEGRGLTFKDSSNTHEGKRQTVFSQQMQNTGMNPKLRKGGFKFVNYIGCDMTFSMFDRKSKDMKSLDSRMVTTLECDRNNIESHITPKYEDQEFFAKQMRMLKAQLKREQQQTAAESQYLNQFGAAYFEENKEYQIDNDFIEEDPLAINLNIGGAAKIMEVPLDIVGVYSFSSGLSAEQKKKKSAATCASSCFSLPGSKPKDDKQRLTDESLNVIVNIDTRGKQKTISFESQLQFVNNLMHSISLEFKIKSLNKLAPFKKKNAISGTPKRIQFENESNPMDRDKEEHREGSGSGYQVNQIRKSNIDGGNEAVAPGPVDQSDADKQDEEPDEFETVVIDLEQSEVYRVPLTWLMKGSIVDVSLIKKEKDHKQNKVGKDASEIVFEDIAKIFCKTAADQSDQNEQEFTAGLRSKIVELNDDFYASVDIQGFGCLPKDTIDSNPIQYVVSLNPPLMMTNYCMNPIELYEIDAPDDPTKREEKRQAQIAPSMSSYIVQLDLSTENTSHIKIQIIDTVLDCKLTHVIEKLGIDTVTTTNEAQNRNESELTTYDFKRHWDSEEEGKELDPEALERRQKKKEEKMGDGEICPITLEMVNKSYSESFVYRERLIDISIAKKIMIYPKYMIVNKTEKPIIYNQTDTLRQTVGARANDYLMGTPEQKDKIRFRYESKETGVEYQDTELVDLTTLGLSGVITMDLKTSNQGSSKKEQRAASDQLQSSAGIPVDSLGEKVPTQLQFGISIQQAVIPYTKTVLITIVPRYLIVNQLPFPIRVRQFFGEERWGKPIRIEREEKKESDAGDEIVPEGPAIFQKELHLDKETKGKKSSKNALDFKIQFGALPSLQDDTIYNSSPRRSGELGQIDSKGAGQEPQEWCRPFPINDLDDFQTETDGTHKPNGHQGPVGGPEGWFSPQESNNHKLITRVIVTQDARDNNASTLIIFDEPAYEEYKIVNETKGEIAYCKQDQAGRELSAWITVAASGKQDAQRGGEKEQAAGHASFVWDTRDSLSKRIKVRIGVQESLIQIDKCSEADRGAQNGVGGPRAVQPHKLFHSDSAEYSSTVHLTPEGTKVLTISQKERKRHTAVASLIGGIGSVRGALQQSLARRQTGLPQLEKDKAEQQANGAQGAQGMNVKVNFKGFGLSFINDQPRGLIYLSMSGLELNYVSKNYANLKKTTECMDQTDTIIDLKIANFQIDNLINDEMPVVMGAKQYYEKHLQKASGADMQSNLSQFIKIVPDRDIKKGKRRGLGRGRDEADATEKPPFIVFYVDMNEKSHAERVGSIRRYERVQFVMQEFFIQVESSILNDNLKFVMETLSIFSYEAEEDEISTEEAFQTARAQQRRELCPMVDASKGVVFDPSQAQVDKVSFGVIQLGAIQASLTFKLEKRSIKFDFTNPRAFFGLGYILYPFIQNFAQISDAGIKLKELILLEGYYSQEGLTKTITAHLWQQAARQAFRLIGSSDMIGNPTGLVDKVGTGFVELARDPIQGLREGPEEFIQGLGTGVQAVVRGVVGGGFQSISGIAGSLYSVVKQTAGGEDTRGAPATNVAAGVYQGITGFGSEVVSGVTGVFSQPYRGARAEGVKGFAKGVGRGLVGVAVTPVAGVLRAGQSVSRGISASANDLSDLGKTKLELLDTKTVRVRYPRRIEKRGQIKIYNEDLAIINRLLKKIHNGFFYGQQIRFYALLPTIDQSGEIQDAKKFLIVITNDYLIYLKVYSFFDFQKDKYIENSLWLCERLANIESYSVKQQPAQIVPNEIEKINVYKEPYYFLTICFKKSWVKVPAPRQLEDSQIKSSEASKPQDTNQLVGMSPVLRKSASANPEMAPKPIQPRRLGPQQDEEDGEQRDGNLAAPSGGTGKAPEAPAPNADDLDMKTQYRYVFFSPCVEVFNRMHLIFQSNPELCQNIKHSEAERRRNKKNKNKK